MINIEDMYEEIDALWPIKKRDKSVRELERKNLELTITSDEDFVKLKNKIEIEIFDKDPKRLKPLLQIIASTKSTPKPVIVNQVPQEEIEEPEEKVDEADEAEEAFKEIFYAWPEND